ncbi:hypothetical protein KW846_23195 [Pseudomonas sp. PDM32]|uniref:hypothetical protein n=1 Tax=Pseudomonas sp. PDM32 TaxID=2854768 RepID=UPI001C45B951|nr:hypothetical protein [Pseudomonas sp. PDM32]MBV7575627.1 hypothetical protein [Pseudomonas sp. PDM32]
MSSIEAKNIINSEDEWIGDEKKQAQRLLEYQGVPERRGRVNATLRVDQPSDAPGTEIQLRKMYFYQNKDTPSFFLLAKGEGEYEGTEVRLSGDDLEVGKLYTISHGLKDVDARFDRAGLTIYPRTVPEGTLTIRSLDSQSIEGSFRFTVSNWDREDKKEIDFYCTNFVVNLQE